MTEPTPKRWPYRGRELSYADAVGEQERVRSRVVRDWDGRDVAVVAGIDVGVKDGVSTAACVLLAYPGFEVIETARASKKTEFPYIPGLLAFREVPVVLEAFARLTGTPDLVLVDGMGRLHPRRCGVACMIGLELDVPVIGVGKTPFIGDWREPAERRGSRTQVVHEGERIGRVVRTRDGVKPVFVSEGHKIDLETAARWVLRCTPRYRLPEPIRAAHGAAGEPLTPRRARTGGG